MSSNVSVETVYDDHRALPTAQSLDVVSLSNTDYVVGLSWQGGHDKNFIKEVLDSVRDAQGTPYVPYGVVFSTTKRGKAIGLWRSDEVKNKELLKVSSLACLAALFHARNNVSAAEDMAEGITVYIESVTREGRSLFWVCPIRDGLPMTGGDSLIETEKELHERLDEWRQMGDVVEAWYTLSEAGAALTSAQQRFYRLKPQRVGLRAKHVVGAIAVVVLIVVGWQGYGWFQKNKKMAMERITAQSGRLQEQETARLNKLNKINESKRILLAGVTGSTATDNFSRMFAVVAKEPLVIPGWELKKISCTVELSACNIEYQRTTGNINQLNALVPQAKTDFSKMESAWWSISFPKGKDDLSVATAEENLPLWQPSLAGNMISLSQKGVVPNLVWVAPAQQAEVSWWTGSFEAGGKRMSDIKRSVAALDGIGLTGGINLDSLSLSFDKGMMTDWKIKGKWVAKDK